MSEVEGGQTNYLLPADKQREATALCGTAWRGTCFPPTRGPRKEMKGREKKCAPRDSSRALVRMAEIVNRKYPRVTLDGRA